MNAEEKKAYNAAYRVANKEKLAAYNAAYYAANKEKPAAQRAGYQKQYYEANKEKILVYSKAYYATNGAAKRAYAADRARHHRAILSDQYLRGRMRTAGIPDAPPALLSATRIHITIKRELKQRKAT